MKTLPPVTFLFDFEHTNDASRPYILHEFAANGARHMVLTDTLIAMIMRSPKLEDTLIRELQAEGLTFLDSHAPFSPFFDLNCPFPEHWQEMICRQQLAIAIAGAMGVDTIAIHIGNDNFAPLNTVPFERQLENILGALDILLPMAQKNDMTICIENTELKMNTPEVLLEIKKHFPQDNLGFCYDAGHANLLDKGRNYKNGVVQTIWENEGHVGEPVWDDRVLEKMLPYVVNCHLHDNDGSDDQHRNIGHGNVDWCHIIRLLAQAPRLKSIQSEVIAVREHESISEICKKFLNLDRYLA